jgi:hypothetical protein
MKQEAPWPISNNHSNPIKDWTWLRKNQKVIDAYIPSSFSHGQNITITQVSSNSCPNQHAIVSSSSPIH